MSDISTLCPICAEPLYEQDTWACRGKHRIVLCRGCQNGVLLPWPTLNDVHAQYVFDHSSPSINYLEVAPFERREFSRRITDIKRYAPGNRLLDLGCNIGTFMAQAEECGFKCQGIEINENALRIARANNLAVNSGRIDCLEFGEGQFDVVTMNDVLEHLPDPCAVLKQVRRVLCNAGVLLISTPNFLSPVAKLTGKHWLHFKPVEHLLYYSPRSLKTLLESNGFNVIVSRNFPRRRPLRIVFEKLATYSPAISTLLLKLPQRVLRWGVTVNLGDEMVVIARKN